MSLERGIDTFVIDPSTITFVSQNPIAEGGNAYVYLVKDQEGNEYVAKVGKRPISNYQDEKSFIRELMILSKVNSPCIVSLKGFSFFPNFQESKNINKFPTVILEKASSGSIRTKINQCIKNKPDPNWTPTKRMIALAGTAYGMRYLHSKHIIHRDLKPDNVLLSDNLHPKITDFGLSKIQYDQQQTMTDQGTLFYLAPEIIQGQTDYTNSVDVYAYGIMAFEIVVLKLPYKVLGNIMTIPFEVSKGRRPIFPSTVNPLLKKLITDCWSGCDAERPTFDEIFQYLSNPEYLIPDVDLEEYNAYLSTLKDDSVPLCLNPEVQEIVDQALKGNTEKMKEAADGFYDGLADFPFDKNQALNFYRMFSIASSASQSHDKKFDIQEKDQEEEKHTSNTLNSSIQENNEPKSFTNEELLASLSPEVTSLISNAESSQFLFDIANKFNKGEHPFPQNYQLSSYYYKLAFEALQSETDLNSSSIEIQSTPVLSTRVPIERAKTQSMYIPTENLSFIPIDFRPLCFQALKSNIPHVNIFVYGAEFSISPAMKALKSNQNSIEQEYNSNFMRYDIEGKGISIFQAKDSDSISSDTVLNFIKEKSASNCETHDRLLMCFFCLSPSKNSQIDEMKINMAKNISKLIYTVVFVTTITDNTYIEKIKKVIKGKVYRKEKKIDGKKLKKTPLIFDLKLSQPQNCTSLIQDFINFFPNLSIL